MKRSKNALIHDTRLSDGDASGDRLDDAHPMALLAGPRRHASESLSRDAHVGGHGQGICLLESFFAASQACLATQRGSQVAAAAVAYLEQIGFDGTALETLPIGLFAGRESMRHALVAAGFDPAEVDSSVLLADSRLDGRIVGPIRTLNGLLTGFWARDPDGLPPRQLFFSGAMRQDAVAYGLDVALRASHGCGGHIVLMEGILDAILFQSRGLLNTAAVLNNHGAVTAKRWQRLAEWGVQRVTLAFENDAEAADRILAALGGALQADACPEIYLLPPEELRPHLTPAQWLRDRSTARWEAMLSSRAIHAYSYIARLLLAKLCPSGVWTQAARREALDEAVEFYASQDASRRDALDSHFVPVIVRELDLGWSVEERAEKPELTAAVSEPRVAARRRVGGPCRLHRCDHTDCFCFD